MSFNDKIKQPRSTKINEYQSVIDFLNKNLRPHSSWSIAEEYPLALQSNNIQNMTIIEDENKIVAHATNKIFAVKTPIGLLKVSAIGSVITDPLYRNKGYSHRILTSCLKKANAENCDLAILWTDLFDFYRKVGFELVGSEISYNLTQPLPDLSHELKFLKTAAISAEAMLKIYSQHSVGTVRTLSDIQKSLKIPNARVYTAWDKMGQLKAYVVEGKGADLNGYIHEWGGMLSDLIPLLRFVQKSSDQPLTLIASAHNKGLIRKFEELRIPSHEGYLGMVNILSPLNVLNKVNTFAKSIGVDNFSISPSEEGYLLQVKNEAYSITNKYDLCCILFGPKKASDLLGCSAESKAIIDKILPIPFWIWGWDSI